MALVKCKECNEEISSKAKVCPKCGVKPPKKTSLFTWLVLIIIVFVIYSVSQSPTSTKVTTKAKSSTRAIGGNTYHVGFDRMKWTQMNEESFDRYFQYSRSEKEKFKNQYILKNGSVKEKAMILAKINKKDKIIKTPQEKNEVKRIVRGENKPEFNKINVKYKSGTFLYVPDYMKSDVYALKTISLGELKDALWFKELITAPDSLKLISVFLQKKITRCKRS